VRPKTYYEILGVAKDATPDQVRRAYRRVVLKHHPDRSSDPGSVEILHQANRAFEVLSDPVRRRQYDRELNPPPKPPPAATTKTSTPPKAQPRPSAAASQRRTATPATNLQAELNELTILIKRGNFMLAEQAAKNIIASNPKVGLPYAVLGDIARKNGDRNEAAKMYAYAIQFEPNNTVYQRRYEQLLEQVVPEVRASCGDADETLGAFMTGTAAMIVLGCCFALMWTGGKPAFPKLPLIGSWNLTTWVVTIVAGVSLGSCLSIGNLIDRINATVSTSLGGPSPTVVLGLLALINFWFAAALYVLIGVTRQAFHYSTTRIVGSVAMTVLCFTIGVAFQEKVSSVEVFLWSGNLIYLAAMLGWLVCDAFRVERYRL
jgi:uncharacterized membrane protein YqgA involved in biofilm formation